MVVERHAIRFADVVYRRTCQPVRERRRMAARTEDLDIEIAGDDSPGPLRDGQRNSHGDERLHGGPFRDAFGDVATRYRFDGVLGPRGPLRTFRPVHWGDS